jgi:hypothetical protein
VQTTGSHQDKWYKPLAHIKTKGAIYWLTSRQTVQTTGSHQEKWYNLLAHIKTNGANYWLTSRQTVQTTGSHKDKWCKPLAHINTNSTNHWLTTRQRVQTTGSHQTHGANYWLTLMEQTVRFCAPVQTDSGAHPASYTMGNRSISRG